MPARFSDSSVTGRRGPAAVPERFPSERPLYVPGLMYSEYALFPLTVSDSEVARAGLLWLEPGTTLDPWYHMSLPRPDWS